jgi:hypothetical protein
MRSKRTRLTTAALGAAIAVALTAGAASAADYYGDRDWNPPGPAGGPGTNWENPPGPVGGPGASPDLRVYRPGVAFGPGIVLVLPGDRYWTPRRHAPARWHHWRHDRRHDRWDHRWDHRRGDRRHRRSH